MTSPRRAEYCSSEEVARRHEEMNDPIYLDNHATTPVDPRVLDAMLPYFREHFGNAASRSHAFGWRAQAAVEKAREQLALAIGARPREIVFTSGATEANNLALKGVATLYRQKGTHVVTVATEHKSVLDPAERLEAAGFSVTRLPVGRDGLIDLERLARAIVPGTILVSVMAANNEIGVLQPITEIGALCRERRIIFHTDAAQALGKVPLDVDGACVDLMSLSAHKLYGPKGVGALFVRSGRPRVRLSPMMDGGGHERGLRSGTLDVPGIVGFGQAAELGAAAMAEESTALRALRDRLLAGLQREVPELIVNGDLERRLPGNLNVSIPGVDADALISRLGDIAISSGSACTSASLEPSHVLGALGLEAALARASVRFGLGRFNTASEIDRTIERVSAAVRGLRGLAETIRQAPGTESTGERHGYRADAERNR